MRLIAVLVALAVAVLGVVVYTTGGGFSGVMTPRKDKVGETVVGQVRARALDAKCMGNLRDVRATVEASVDADGNYPQTLGELRLSAEQLKCPIGSELYLYTPDGGDGRPKVMCQHAGHEKY
jgi:hypothetical protein